MTKNTQKVDAYRKRLKLRMVEAFGSKCGVCSYNKCVHALEFHHLDPSQKEFGFAKRWSRAWAKLVVELQKCVLLCSNCHKEYHAGILKIPENVQRFDEALIKTPHQYHKVISRLTNY